MFAPVGRLVATEQYVNTIHPSIQPTNHPISQSIATITTTRLYDMAAISVILIDLYSTFDDDIGHTLSHTHTPGPKNIANKLQLDLCSSTRDEVRYIPRSCSHSIEVFVRDEYLLTIYMRACVGACILVHDNDATLGVRVSMYTGSMPRASVGRLYRCLCHLQH